MLWKSWEIASLSVIFLVSIFAVNWQTDRTEFLFIASFYTIAFSAYLGLIALRKDISFQSFIFLAIAAHVTSMIFLPHLSNDFYRFLWDGELTTRGINPFDFRPSELLGHNMVQSSQYMQELYVGIGEMSQQNYSCYPPLSQLYFIVATVFSDSIIFNTIILKLLIVGTEIIGAIYLMRLLKLFSIDINRMWLLFLNPLCIIECTGNAHFEGVMLSFLFIAFYHIFQSKLTLASLFYGIAIQIKLIPLMLLPFFYRFLAIKKALFFYSLTIVITLGSGFIQLNSHNIENFLESLRLYFQVFEFNSFVLYHHLQLGMVETGWNMTRYYGPQLSRIAVGIIFTLALYGQINDWQKLFKRMTLAFFVYLLLSSTLHPWYILPLLALSLFTEYRFALVWSFAVFFSYIFYAYNDSNAFWMRFVVNMEYLLVIGYFIYEIWLKKKLRNQVQPN